MRSGGAVEEPTAREEKPVEDDLAGFAFGVDFGLDVEILFLAVETDGEELLVEAVVLEEGSFVKDLAYVLGAVVVDQPVEFLFLQDLQLHVHLAVLADSLHLFLSHPVHDLLQKQVLLP